MSLEAERRNLLEGWCPQGESLSQVLRRRDPVVLKRIESEGRDLKDATEVRAAFLLHAFTGLDPAVEDDQRSRGQGRNGAVDIVLSAPDGQRQIAEVTSSLDTTYQRSSAALARFESEIAQRYEGAMSWMLDLERGWESLRLVREVAPDVAAKLNQLDSGSIDTDGSFLIHPLVTAWPLAPTDPPIVYVQSRNAGASNLEGPYLDALSDYLSTDRTIEGKLSKLTRETPRFGSTRCHLFVGMASTGSWGGLLPSSPSYFTWGEFSAPMPLTDLWLEGGTGELYHWTREADWFFHDLEK